ncbi:hypothetical protein [Nesterenkonia ebinurensis]|uniref:hypothetical protein n=1 Tax=Nesterenkonia ebinurensis TaxID=2608252 RepID=UPI00168BC06D|nr:hypothetical protein [Nesterenkonia ebinurensis]
MTGPKDQLGYIESALSDLRAATKAQALELVSEWEAAKELKVSEVHLAESE